MTAQELWIAKLSKTLNNGSLNPYSPHQTLDSAYKQTISSLEKSLKEEKSRVQRDQIEYNLGVNALMTEENLKKQAYRHHSLVLEAQIKENHLRKRINAETPQPIQSEYESKPSKITNFKLRDELLKQIQEKELNNKKETEADKQFGQQMIQSSEKLLQQEYMNKHQARQKAYFDMVNSWEETIRVNQMKKQLEKIRIYGPKPEYVQTQPIAEETEYRVETPALFKSVPKKIMKKFEKSFDWKTGLRSTSVKSSASKAAGKSFNSIIEKFSTLNSREKSIQNDKEKLLKYFESKQKSRDASKTSSQKPSPPSSFPSKANKNCNLILPPLP